mmetsp:Transcript_2762/g.6600  ORF Transcript_2762/g.6600 Transcript_2762/m.6600 type:complete len:264 (-) Transcript_2762:18-809(-)
MTKPYVFCSRIVELFLGCIQFQDIDHSLQAVSRGYNVFLCALDEELHTILSTPRVRFPPTRHKGHARGFLGVLGEDLHGVDKVRVPADGRDVVQASQRLFAPVERIRRGPESQVFHHLERRAIAGDLQLVAAHSAHGGFLVPVVEEVLESLVSLDYVGLVDVLLLGGGKGHLWGQGGCRDADQGGAQESAATRFCFVGPELERGVVDCSGGVFRTRQHKGLADEGGQGEASERKRRLHGFSLVTVSTVFVFVFVLGSIRFDSI